jgi:hypothetical protein
LSACLLDLRRLPVSDQSVVRLKLLDRLYGVVDQCETSALAATILRPEAKDRNLVFGGLVEFRELLAQLVFGNVCAVRVEYVATNIEVLEIRCVGNFDALVVGG